MQSDNQRLKERLSRVKPDPIDLRTLIFAIGATIGVIAGIILVYAYADRIDEYFTPDRQINLGVILLVLAAVFGVRWFVNKIKS